MKVHKLKCWPEEFEAISRGLKTCEIRRNDRDYQPGDVLRLQEFDPYGNRPMMALDDDPRYTGRALEVFVRHLARGGRPPLDFLSDGIVVMSIEELPF